MSTMKVQRKEETKIARITGNKNLSGLLLTYSMKWPQWKAVSGIDKLHSNLVNCFKMMRGKEKQGDKTPASAFDLTVTQNGFQIVIFLILFCGSRTKYDAEVITLHVCTSARGVRWLKGSMQLCASHITFHCNKLSRGFWHLERKAENLLFPGGPRWNSLGAKI